MGVVVRRRGKRNRVQGSYYRFVKFGVSAALYYAKPANYARFAYFKLNFCGIVDILRGDRFCPVRLCLAMYFFYVTSKGSYGGRSIPLWWLCLQYCRLAVLALFSDFYRVWGLAAPCSVSFCADFFGKLGKRDFFGRCGFASFGQVSASERARETGRGRVGFSVAARVRERDFGSRLGLRKFDGSMASFPAAGRFPGRVSCCCCGQFRLSGAGFDHLERLNGCLISC